MLGDRRIVIVLRAERLLKPKRAAKAAARPRTRAEADEAEAASISRRSRSTSSRPSPSTTLVFVAAEIDRGAPVHEAPARAGATVAEFAGLVGRRRRRAAREVPGGGGRADRADELAARRAHDRAARRCSCSSSAPAATSAKLRGDVERLLLYTEGQKRISRDDVDEIVVDVEVAVEDEWAVVNAIADGDAGRALREAGRRLDRGDSPHALVGQLRWWVSTRLAEADAEPRASRRVEALLRTDLALKSSGGDERVLVERLVVELTGKPLPRSPLRPGRR